MASRHSYQDGDEPARRGTPAPFPGFRRPNFTIMPDEVFDELLPDLSGGEIKVLLSIIRRTFGFKQDADSLSVAQITKGITTRAGHVIDRGAGVSLGTAQAAIKSLVEKNIIVALRNSSDERGDLPSTYGLRFADPVANFYQRGAAEISRGGVPETGIPRYQESATQETVRQETVRQEDPPCPRQAGGSHTPATAHRSRAPCRG
jgi:phage replication O-like protein O